MKHIKSKGKQFVLALKSSRLIALNQKDPQRGEFKKLSELELGENTAVGAYIKGVPFPLLIAKQVLINRDGSTGILDLVGSDLSLDYLRITSLSKTMEN